MTTEQIMHQYDLTEEDVAPHALVNTDNGWRTAVKECAAIKRMNQFKVLSQFFGNCRYKWVTDKETQLSGIDLIIDSSINVDLKSLIGNAYTITDEDNPFWDGKYDPCIIVEISQNNVFTNTNDKKTDYVLYYIGDKIEEKFILVDYAEIKHISNIELFTKKHVWHTSNNDTGIYIKIPLRELKTLKVLKL
jgi:hypothetical protein